MKNALNYAQSEELRQINSKEQRFQSNLPQTIFGTAKPNELISKLRLLVNSVQFGLPGKGKVGRERES